MALEYDSDGNVQKITGLIHSGKIYTITFISGSYHGIDKVGYITQQLVHLPIPSLSLSEALQLTEKIATALGEGPAGSANPVKPVSGIDNDGYDSFIVNFFDTGINLYDNIDYHSDGIRYIPHGEYQLSELFEDPSDWDAPHVHTARTIAIIEWKKKVPWWCWLVPWWC